MRVKQQHLLPILLFLFIAAMVPGLKGYGDDMGCWRQWTCTINEGGLENVYANSKANYPPLYMYVLWLFSRIMQHNDAIWNHIGYLRLATLAAEYWGLWIVYRWMDRKIDYNFLLLCSVLNVAYMYNTLYWGQVDGMLAALLCASFYYLWRSRLVWSAVLLLLAFNLKIQTLVVIPLWGLLALTMLRQRRLWRDLVVMVPVLVAVESLILLPFALSKQGLGPMLKVVTGLPGAYPYVSMNAFNIWYLFIPGAGPGYPDNLRALGLTYNQLGLIAFCTASAVIMWPLLRLGWSAYLNNGRTAPAPETIWLSAAMLTLVFFFFNTQMHERYVHPAFIFLTAYAFKTRRFGLYAIFSAAYVLNLESIIKWWQLPDYSILPFQPRFVAVLYAMCIVWGTLALYRSAKATQPPAPEARLQSGQPSLPLL